MLDLHPIGDGGEGTMIHFAGVLNLTKKPYQVRDHLEACFHALFKKR